MAIISSIRTTLNNLTPGMTFKKYAKHVFYHGQDCGYIEFAGKKKYVLTPALDKLERKLSFNNFDTNIPKKINLDEFKAFKTLIKPFISNEKGLKKMRLSNNLYYSPSPASILIWDKNKNKPIITIIKKMKYPTKEIIYNALPFLRRILRESPYKF